MSQEFDQLSFDFRKLQIIFLIEIDKLRRQVESVEEKFKKYCNSVDTAMSALREIRQNYKNMEPYEKIKQIERN